MEGMDIFWLVVSVLVLVFWVAVFHQARRQRRLVEHSASWPSVSGTVTRSSVEAIEEESISESGYRLGSRITGYTVEVAYRYEVGGRTYECDRVRFKVSEEMFGTEAAAQAIADRYKAGQSVRVFHDPANPKEARVLPMSPV